MHCLISPDCSRSSLSSSSSPILSWQAADVLHRSILLLASIYLTLLLVCCCPCAVCNSAGLPCPIDPWTTRVNPQCTTLGHSHPLLCIFSCPAARHC